MTQIQLMFIMWLTDTIIMLSNTLKKVNSMTDEEIMAEIPVVEAKTQGLMEQLRAHGQ